LTLGQCAKVETTYLPEGSEWGCGRARVKPWYRRVLDDFDVHEATPEQIDAVFTSRKIVDVVSEGRPYTAYRAGDVDAVLKADPRLKPWKGLRRVVKQRPGLVMHRDT
jgi:hypothetical protein